MRGCAFSSGLQVRLGECRGRVQVRRFGDLCGRRHARCGLARDVNRNIKPTASMPASDPKNRWAKFILVLAGIGVVAGLVLTTARSEQLRSPAFWTLMIVGGLAIVGAIGWAYTEIRHQEAASIAAAPGTARSGNRQVLRYVGVLIVVALIAVGATMVPRQFAPLVWALYVPIWLVGGWWFRRRGRSARNWRQRSR